MNTRLVAGEFLRIFSKVLAMAAIKEALYKLIHTTDDEELLKDIFMILSSRCDHKEGDLWNGLTEEQRREVLASESEIGDESAWESHDERRRRNAKWSHWA
jgi:hypothetical protein